MNYITTKVAAIPNYADRHRHGEPIATGFVESAVNQVVSKRLVKKQQMTPNGAHRLLQVRARVPINSYAATSSAGILNFGPLPIPFALPRSTRSGPLSNIFRSSPDQREYASPYSPQFCASRMGLIFASRSCRIALPGPRPRLPYRRRSKARARMIMAVAGKGIAYF